MLDLMVWEGMGAPGKAYVHDNVMLGRSGWAGSQKYGGAVWSGDTQSTVSGALPTVLPLRATCHSPVSARFSCSC
eukprot:COSAG05_NODE_4027_length_1712_cov_1.133912_2_plen_75_part_00